MKKQKQKLIPELVLSLQDGYTANRLLKDCIAGIIVGIIALPLSIALAIASGAGPAVGLITAIFAGGVAAVLGGSKTQVSGPTGAFVVIVFGIIAKNGMSGLVMATFMAGIFIIIMGLLRLGKLIKYIPLPIITGFTAGIAVTIFIGQINDFLGLGLKDMPSENLHKLVYTLSHIAQLSWITVAMGVFAVAIIALVPKIQKILPGPLVAIIVCTVINLFLPTKCITLGDIFGTVNINISFSFGFFDFSQLPSLIVPAVTIAFLAAVESLLSAVVADGMTHSKHNPNMELIGQGVANIASSLFGGLPATGAIARTSANIRSGGRTPVAAVVHSVVILLLSLFLMPYAKYIPMTVFAAILIVVCYNMLNVEEIKKVLKTTPVDIGLMALTFALTVAFDLVVAILVCTSLSLGYQLFKRYVKKHTAEKEIIDGTTKLKGSISYMNYDKLFDTASSAELVLDMTDVVEIDATFTDFLISKAKKKQVRIHNANGKIHKQLARHPEISMLLNQRSS